MENQSSPVKHPSPQDVIPAKKGRASLKQSTAGPVGQDKGFVETVTAPKPTAPSAPIVTIRQFIIEKLENCKKKMAEIETLKGSPLLAAFQQLGYAELVDWITWIKQQEKTIDEGLSDMFSFHKMDIRKLTQEEFGLIRRYFDAFVAALHM